nr:hypothetical protein [Tanacetum cinerariifolium]
HDVSFGVDDLDLNLNKLVDLNVSQLETQFELYVFKEPDVGRTHGPIFEEVRTQELIVKEVIVEDYMSSKEDAEQDQENEIIKPDVDVHLFGISIEVPFDNIGVTNLVLDDVLR